MRLLEEKQFSIFKFNFVMEDLMHTMSCVHIVRQASMPSVLFFILAEQKNEQHTPIILFTPNICKNNSEGNLFVLNDLVVSFLFF